MAYSDGNSVALTPDYGFTIANPAGLSTSGWPITFAVAFKVPSGTTWSGNRELVSASGATVNHRVSIQIYRDAPDTYSIDLFSRAGTSGTVRTRTFSAALGADTWYILVARFDDGDDWRAALTGASAEAFSTIGAPSPSSVDDIWLANHFGSVFFDGVIAYGAYWFSALSDANMDAIAAGTTSPDALSPDELIYFEGTTAIEGENGSTVSVVGTGSIAAEGTDPAGWPPSAGGGPIVAEPGIAEELDEALSVAAAKQKAVGQNAEVDSATAVVVERTFAVGLNAETDAPFSIDRLKTLIAGLSAEVDEALQLQSGTAVAVGLASEDDAALALERAKAKSAGLSSESDETLALTRAKLKTIGLNSEADEALQSTVVRQQSVGLGAETDAAQPVGRAKKRLLGLTTEVDYVLSIVGVALTYADAAFRLLLRRR